MAWMGLKRLLILEILFWKVVIFPAGMFAYCIRDLQNLQIVRNWHTDNSSISGRTTETIGWSIFYQDPFQNQPPSPQLLVLPHHLFLLLCLLYLLLLQPFLLCNTECHLDLVLQRMISGTVELIEERGSKLPCCFTSHVPQISCLNGLLINASNSYRKEG